MEEAKGPMDRGDCEDGKQAHRLDRKVLIPVSSSSMGPLEEDEVRLAIRRNWISQGEQVEKVSELLCGMTGRKHCLLTPSGTAALNLALLTAKELELLDGIKIGCPGITFPAVRNAIILNGLEPIYAPHDPDTWQANYDELPSGRVHGIIAAGLGSYSSDLPDMEDNYGYLLIEDAAETFGGSINGRPCGSFGWASVLSFYANKVVTCGEGGALLFDDSLAYERAKRIANHGLGKEYAPLSVGVNCRMTDLQASVLKVQLSRMNELVQLRKELFAFYDEFFRQHPKFKVNPQPPGQKPSYWMYLVVSPNRKSLRCDLHDVGVETRPFFQSESADTTTNQLAYHGLMMPTYAMNWMDRNILERKLNSICWQNHES